MTYGCEVVYDAETAALVRAEIQARLGGECPCDRDEPCPLLPRSGVTSLPVPAQRTSGHLVDPEHASHALNRIPLGVEADPHVGAAGRDIGVAQ